MTMSDHEWEFTKIWFFYYNDTIITSFRQIKTLEAEINISEDWKINKELRISFTFSLRAGPEKVGQGGV